MNIHANPERTLREVQSAADQHIQTAKDLSRAMWRFAMVDDVMNDERDQGVLISIGQTLDAELRKVESIIYGKTVEEIEDAEEVAV